MIFSIISNNYYNSFIIGIRNIHTNINTTIPVNKLVGCRLPARHKKKMIKIYHLINY